MRRFVGITAAVIFAGGTVFAAAPAQAAPINHTGILPIPSPGYLDDATIIKLLDSNVMRDAKTKLWVPNTQKILAEGKSVATFEALCKALNSFHGFVPPWWIHSAVAQINN